MPQESQAFSIRTATHRYVNRQDMPEQLFDLGVNPSEMQDLGRDVGSEQARAGMRDRLLDFPAGHKHRPAVSDEFVAACWTDNHKQACVFFGQWQRRQGRPLVDARGRWPIALGGAGSFVRVYKSEDVDNPLPQYRVLRGFLPRWSGEVRARSLAPRFPSTMLAQEELPWLRTTG